MIFTHSNQNNLTNFSDQNEKEILEKEDEKFYEMAELKEKYILKFDCLKVESDQADQERTVIGDSKTSTSNAFTNEDDNSNLSNLILDEFEPLEKDFISKKRTRKNKKNTRKKKCK